MAHGVGCHEALRLRFHREGPRWTQQVAANAAPPYEHFDLCHLPAGERARALEDKARQVQVSLNLQEGSTAWFASFEALERAGVSPAAALHVGDSMDDDVAGANQAGIEAVLLKRVPQSRAALLARHQPPPRTIHSLLEIL